MPSLKGLTGRTATALTQAANAPAVSTDVKRSTRSPVSNAGAQLMMQGELDRLERRATDAEGRLGKPIELATNDLVVIDTRRRTLSPEEYEILRNNIAANGVLEAIKVRPGQDGHFEVTSGSNRVTICRELGFQTVPCVIVLDSDDAVERRAFYSNLLHAPLPDYEKYLGFAGEIARTGQTQAELAANSGVPQPTISQMLVFGRLPNALRECVASRRHHVSRFTAAALLKAADRGVPESELIALVRESKAEIGPSAVDRLAAPKKAKPLAERLSYRSASGAKVEFIAADDSVRVVGLSPNDKLWLADLVKAELAKRFA